MSTSKEGFSIVLFSSSLFSILIISNSIDTINTTQPLTDGMTIVSSDSTFELGFFSPEDSTNRYLGIWYNKISAGTVVWVANRELPLPDGSGVLSLTDQGIFILIDATNTTIWSTNSSGLVQSPVGQLLDSGNLVVRDTNDDNPDNFLWQSFDYPTDHHLPGMKIGKNLVNGMERWLHSWKSSNDPSAGDFAFGIDPHGFPQMVILNGSTLQFRSGPWNGLRFSGSSGLKQNSIYTYEFVFDEKKVYYIYNLINNSVYTRLYLNPNGILQRFTWNSRSMAWTTYINAPADNCDTYALCHAYGSCNMGNSPVCGCLDKFLPKSPENWERADWTDGCVRRKPLNCTEDGFLMYSHIKLPDTRQSWFNRTMSLEECEAVCLQNCTCMAYASLDIREGGSGCLLWFTELIDIREIVDGGQDIYIRMAYSELATATKDGSNNKKPMKIGISLAVVAGVLVLGLSLILYVRKKKQQRHQQQKFEREEIECCSIEKTYFPNFTGYTNNSQNDDLELPLFDLPALVNATKNFSEENKLGEGGFGPVYKGVLEGGQEIAVKRLSKKSRQGLDEFKNEVICIAKLQHRNLVRLLGCCIQAEENMLIYEYMPNKSLDLFIFDKNRRTLLNWFERFHIINGIARGLLYLHHDSRLRIIHRDLKASNILLDMSMNPKISDFGVARSFEENETKATTNTVVGTHGYMAPEYAVDGLFSMKSDVFSFGVLVLEIVSGMKNKGFFHPDHHLNLLGHAWRLFNEGRSLELIESHLADSCHISQVLRSIHVGLLCVQQSPEDRPSMPSVVLMLGSEDALVKPKRPGFFTERSLPEDGISSSKNTTSSANEFTITVLQAR